VTTLHRQDRYKVTTTDSTSWLTGRVSTGTAASWMRPRAACKAGWKCTQARSSLQRSQPAT
jgi:hypothetical protein